MTAVDSDSIGVKRTSTSRDDRNAGKEQGTSNNEMACGHHIPPTDMLYMTYDGNWLTECESTVVAVKKKKEPSSQQMIDVCLDRTVLHAQGGGQPTDVGEITNLGAADGCSRKMHVTKVTIDRDTGVATHTGIFVTGDDDDASSAENPVLQVGDVVKVSVDIDQRRILSECHTAGHVVDSAMARCGKLFKPTKGYHFLDGPYVEYEGVVPPNERDAFLKELQTAYCQLIDEDIDTKIELMSEDDADAVCNRQAQNFDMDIFADKRTGTIRVVTVAGFPCPCGGTHVRSTGELKANEWNITGLKAKKNVLRVKYGYKKP